MSLVIDFLFPKNCYQCGRTGYYLCPRCQHHLSFQPIKYRPITNFDGILNLFYFKPPVDQLIHDLKFNFVTDIVPNLSQAMSWHLHHHFSNLLSYWQENNFVIIPIPLHPRRFAWRGFNQSSFLADDLSRRLHLPIDNDVLFRRINTHFQSRLTQTNQRLSNLINVFEIKKTSPKNFILFDDVSTTHSTLNSALSVFGQNYSLKPWALTLAGSHR